MRFLAIDLGDKRTGLAVGDDETGQAFPLEVIEAPMGGGDGGARLLAALVEAGKSQLGAGGAGAKARGGLVVGLPLHMDGRESPRAKLVRAFAERIAGATGLPIEFQDERLTSAQADWEMAGSGLTRGAKKERRDALAAAAILRDFLAARKGDKAEEI